MGSGSVPHGGCLAVPHLPFPPPGPALEACRLIPQSVNNLARSCTNRIMVQLTLEREPQAQVWAWSPHPGCGAGLAAPVPTATSSGLPSSTCNANSSTGSWGHVPASWLGVPRNNSLLCQSPGVLVGGRYLRLPRGCSSSPQVEQPWVPAGLQPEHPGLVLSPSCATHPTDGWQLL